MRFFPLPRIDRLDAEHICIGDAEGSSVASAEGSAGANASKANIKVNAFSFSFSGEAVVGYMRAKP